MEDYYIYLPKKLAIKALSVLSDKYRNLYGDSTLYFLFKIYVGQTFQSKKKKYFQISSTYIRDFFGDRTAFTKIKNLLIDRGIIDCDFTYCSRKKCRGFRLNVPKNCFPMTINLEDKKLIRKINSNPKNFKIHLPVHDFLKNSLQLIEIEDSIPGLTAKQMISHQMIKMKDFHFSVDEYGRVHTNLTNMSSSLRKFLKVENQKLVNIDIRNSQPLFLSVMFKHLSKTDLKTSDLGKQVFYLPPLLPLCCQKERFFYASLAAKPDVKMYTTLCEQGEFYDWIMDGMKVPSDDRKIFKRRFFGKVFFCESQMNDESEFFKKYFPSIFDFITEMKSVNYKVMANVLQRVESHFIIENVAARLCRQKPHMFLSTIHDSFLIENHDVNFVLEVLQEEFGKLGLEPKINPEYY